MRMFDIFKRHTETREEVNENGMEQFKGEIFEIEFDEVPHEFPNL